jgi:hypothetical protein
LIWPKGSRNRLSFLAAFCEDFEQFGISAIIAARRENPAAYLRVCAALVPKQIENAPNPLADFTDDELQTLDAWLDSLQRADDSQK